MEKVIVFSLNEEYYGLSVMTVKEVVKIVELIPVPGSIDFIEGVMNLRGKVIPVINLEKRFGLEKVSGNYQHIIVVEAANLNFGILVDGVSEVLTISSDAIQPVSETLSKKVDINLLKGIIVEQKATDENKTEKGERLILYLNPDTIFTETQAPIVSNITQENIKEKI